MPEPTAQPEQTPPSDTSPATSSAKKTAKTQRLGDFKILKKLGQGGMGAVYLAHQVSLDRRCALKVMSTEIAKKQDFVKRFIREARLMAKIEHPSVVRCYAVGEHKGVYYVAMEFIDGASMQDWIDTKTQLSVGDALHVTIVCAQALGHAHKMNLIHRDIKPDNILVTKHGAVKVADLGLAKAIDDDHSMTQSGTGMGTPLYMPPEQARNAKHVDQRSDIYALGCTLYKFLTGVPPYKADSTLELIIAKESGKFTPAARINKEIPEKLDLMIDKMIAKDPQHRYQNCEALLDDLLSLGLENPQLSFIESDEKVTLGMNSASSVQSVARQTAPVKATSQPVKTSRDDAQTRERASAQKGVWIVHYIDRTGNKQVKKMDVDQIHRGLATKLLDETCRLSRGPKAPLTPIGSVPAFKEQVKELLIEKSSSKKKEDMQSLYAKIDRQHGRRKWWRLLDNIKSGTLGWMSLVLWIGLIAAVGYGLFLGVPIVWEMIADNFGLNQPSAP